MIWNSTKMLIITPPESWPTMKWFSKVNTRLVHSTSRLLGIRKIGAEEERQLLLGLVSELRPASFARLDIGILKI